VVGTTAAALLEWRHPRGRRRPNFLGLSERQLVFSLILGGGLLFIVGVALLRRRRQG
jgi:hypothetical protein